MFSRIKESGWFTKIKNSDIYETLNHSKNYLFSSLIEIGVSILFIPIFTGLLSTDDYGIIAIYITYLGIFGILFTLNVSASITRYYYEKKSDFGEFLFTSLILALTIFFFNFLIYLIFFNEISVIIQLPRLVLLYLIISSFFIIWSNIYKQIAQPQKLSVELSTVNIFGSVTKAILGMLLILSLQNELYLGRIWGLLIIDGLLTIFFLYRIIPYIKFKLKINKDHIKYILSYSLPLLPYALSGIILAQFDRIMINNLIGSSAAGLYSLGYRIGSMVLIVMVALQRAYTPDFYKFLNNNQYSRLDLLSKRIFSIFIFSVLGLILFADEIAFVLVNEKFYEGVAVIPVVAIGYVFFGMFVIYGSYIGYAKKTIYTSVISLSAGIFNIVLNSLLIPKFGFIVAAYTTVASYFILAALAWGVSKFILKYKTTPLKYVWMQLLLILFFIFLFYTFRLFVNSFLFLLILKVILVVMYILIIFKNELKILLTGIQKN